MRIKFFLTAIFFAVLAIGVSYTSSKVFAAKGCCTGTPENRICVATTDTCATSIKSCDDTKNVRSGAGPTPPDVNGDGAYNLLDNYNPSCFVPIIVPSQVKITDFGKLFSGAVAFLLLIAFLLAFFYLILGGISWLTSGGDKAGIEAARNKIIAALIGLIIVAATWALFQLVGGALGFNILGGFKVPTLF